MCHEDKDCGRCRKCDDMLCVDDYERIMTGDPECIGRSKTTWTENVQPRGIICFDRQKRPHVQTAVPELLSGL